MKQITLTQNKIALVDDSDYEYLNQWEWQATYDGYNWYAVRTDRFTAKKTVFMHRVIMNAQKGEEVDHENGYGLDNQRFNLRKATHQQNIHNRAKAKLNTSGFKGVRLKKNIKAKPWESRIANNNKLLHLGYYATAVEAAMAYDQAAKELHGEFARLNFTEE